MDKAPLGWAKVCFGVDLQGNEPVIVRAERMHGRVSHAEARMEDLISHAGDPPLTAACLTVRESFVRWIEAPYPAVGKALKVLPTLLDIQLPFALEDCICDFVKVERTSGNAVRALALGTRSSDGRKRLETLQAVGIEAHVLDHEGLALWTQSLREIPADETAAGVRVVMYLGKDRATLVFGRGNMFLGAHAVRQDDAGQIRRLLKAGLQDKAGDTESRRVQWHWTGPGALDTELVEKLKTDLCGERGVSSSIHSEPATFLARALAVRALVAGPFRCNLRSGSIAHPKMLCRNKLQSAKTAGLFLGAGILACCLNLVFGQIVKAKEARIERTFGSLRDALAGYHFEGKGQDALDTVHRETAARKDLMRPFVEAFEPSLIGIIGLMLETGEASGLRYEVLSLSGSKIMVSGTAPAWDGCDRLVKDLRMNGYDVKLDRKEALDDERIPFIIASGGMNK